MRLPDLWKMGGVRLEEGRLSYLSFFSEDRKKTTVAQFQSKSIITWSNHLIVYLSH